MDKIDKHGGHLRLKPVPDCGHTAVSAQQALPEEKHQRRIPKLSMMRFRITNHEPYMPHTYRFATGNPR